MPIPFLLSAALSVAEPSAGAQVAPRLAAPIACVIGRDCEIQNYVDRDPGPGATDYRCGSRSYEAHSGVDIRIRDMAAQRAGVAVLAAADGKVLRVRDGVADISVKQAGSDTVKGQECGNGLVIEHAGGLSTQYCHMAKGSITVKPGLIVKTGDKLGLVGLSGNTEYPHLHFTVRRGAMVIDPFAPDVGAGASRCGSGQDLWRPETRAAFAYKVSAVLNAGFSAGPIDMAAIETGGIAPPNASAPALVAYVRAIGLKAGDQQILTIVAPDGRILVQGGGDPVPRDQAQRLLYVGKPRPATGWTKGRYAATYRVLRAGKVALEKHWDLAL